MLLLWNVAYVCLLIALTIGYVALKRSGMEDIIPFSEALANFVFQHLALSRSR